MVEARMFRQCFLQLRVLFVVDSLQFPDAVRHKLLLADSTWMAGGREEGFDQVQVSPGQRHGEPRRAVLHRWILHLRQAEQVNRHLEVALVAVFPEQLSVG